ncbi:YigZ family protein [Candidatus Poribacteria bacterium]|nr:YigZ family protein [Candidatus Poribacteria bacterium]
MSDQYKTIVEIAESKLVVKKSRFIGLAASIDAVQAVKDFVTIAQEKYPRATHYCYAYSVGFGREKREYATDAGEPTHSAGPPILTSLKAAELSNVICVIVRYYGGINLGMGGLIRAYGKCAKHCLANAKVETRIFYQALRLRVPHERIGAVVNLCHRLRGNVSNIEYDRDAIIHLQIRQRDAEKFQSKLKGIDSTVEVINAVTS